MNAIRLKGTLPVLLLALAAGACDRLPQMHADIPPPPSAEEVRQHYVYDGELRVEMSGNVAQVSVVVDPEPFRRGGDLWAKAMPYIFLFSPGTRDALEAYEGLGGVRVIALHPNGDVMAQALLPRAEMGERDWQRALSIAQSARREGTERPGRMRDLVQWGEDRTEFEYNPRYVPAR